MFASPVYVIAEAGVNHNGDESRALELIDIAKAAGADAVKFQLFDPDSLVTHTATTAEYQAKNLDDHKISQRDMLKTLTLPDEAYVRLEARCKQRGIDFLCTPFDHKSLDYLVTHTQMKYLKLASGEVTNGPLLLAAARTGLPIILSTGMSELEEVSVALSIIHFGYMHKNGNPKPSAATPEMLKDLRGKVTILHCVSQYPAPAEASNLRAIKTMRDAFGLPVGFSDHTEGIDVSLLAVAEGAIMIEKHFTYDRNAPGPDHKASLLPNELKAMIEGIRAGRKPVISNAEAVLGDGCKTCQKIEKNTRLIARRNVVAAAAIRAGEAFSEQNLICKRPGAANIVPNRLWELLGKPAKRGYAIDEPIKPDELADG